METVHHENPNTYADTWEDCLLAFEGGFTENASTADYWGGKEGDTMAAYSDFTDGPRTRLRYLGEDKAVREMAAIAATEVRLLPDEDGPFVVTGHHIGQGYDDCAILKSAAALPSGIHAASIEKWVVKEKINDFYPAGRRFALKPLED